MYGLRTPEGGGCLLATNEQVNPNADHPDKVNMNDTSTTKKICPACTGHGGVWTGHGDATQCDVCDGWGHLLLNVCVECDRVFDLTEETDSAEWHYGHDCEA